MDKTLKLWNNILWVKWWKLSTVVLFFFLTEKQCWQKWLPNCFLMRYNFAKLIVIKSWQELQRNHCYNTMPVLAVLRAISYRSHRGCNNFVIRKHLSLATYFLQAAPQCLTIESDMQISGNCSKNTGYLELYPKIRKNKYIYNSSHLGLSVSLGFACSQNVDIR